MALRYIMGPRLDVGSWAHSGHSLVAVTIGFDQYASFLLILAKARRTVNKWQTNGSI